MINTIQLYYTSDNDQTLDMERLLTEKHIQYDKIWTPDTDTPYVVICGIDPIHYDDFTVWIREQKGNGEVSFNGKSLTDLGFVP